MSDAFDGAAINRSSVFGIDVQKSFRFLIETFRCSPPLSSACVSDFYRKNLSGLRQAELRKLRGHGRKEGRAGAVGIHLHRGDLIFAVRTPSRHPERLRKLLGLAGRRACGEKDGKE